ncbi:unnamed protein product [Lampetra planeri]
MSRLSRGVEGGGGAEKAAERSGHVHRSGRAAVSSPEPGPAGDERCPTAVAAVVDDDGVSRTSDQQQATTMRGCGAALVVVVAVAVVALCAQTARAAVWPRRPHWMPPSPYRVFSAWVHPTRQVRRPLGASRT